MSLFPFTPVARCTAALLFIFRTGKNGDTATVCCCHGWARHRLHIAESGIYEFELDRQINDGDVCVLLQNKAKQTILRLDGKTPFGSIGLNSKGKYYLRWEFKRADGRFELKYNKQAD